MVVIRVIFVLLSLVWFRVVVYSSCRESSSFVVLYHFTPNVLIGSFSDTIFLFRVCVMLFLINMLYISCLDVCYAFNMRHIFTYTSWSLWYDLSWRILNLLTYDQKINLENSRLRPISPSDQSSTISISWLCRVDDLPHFELNMTPPFGTIILLY